MKTELTARWDDGRKLYVCYPFLVAEWTSPDGDTWSDKKGSIPGNVGEYATITLEGGPRAGVVVG